MKNKIKSFTLLEVMIVLIIIAAILSLGITAYSNSRKSTTVSEAAGDVIAILKETQNMAKNNTIPKTELAVNKTQSIYYYVIEFQGGDISRSLFRKMNGVWSQVLSGESVKSKLFNNISYRTAPPPQCQYILFENLTGKIKVATSGATLDGAYIYGSSTSSCKLALSLVGDSSYTKNISINAATGTFGIEGETP